MKDYYSKHERWSDAVLMSAGLALVLYLGAASSGELKHYQTDPSPTIQTYQNDISPCPDYARRRSLKGYR